MSKRVSHKASITNRPTCGGPTKAGLGKGISSKTSLMFTRTVNQKRSKDFPDSCTGGGDSIPIVQNGYIHFTTSSDETYSANVRTDFKYFDLEGFFSENNISHTDIAKIEIGKDITTITEFPTNYMRSVNEITLEEQDNGKENVNFRIDEGILYNAEQTTVLLCERNKSGLLIIPETVKTIGVSAFYNCRELKGDLTIPDSVKTIGDRAFAECIGFQGDLIIPDSVQTIGYSAFYYCYGFQGDLIIPDSVQTIESRAFAHCSNLSGDLTIPDSVKTIGNYAFNNCSNLSGDLTIPDSVKTIGNYAFRNCKFTGQLTIPDSVETIGDKAFYNCRGLSGDLTIPDSVQTIGNNAFSYCTGFQGDLTIGNSVKTIGDKAFSNCDNITGVIMSAATGETLGILSGEGISFYGITVSVTFTQ